MEIRQAVTQYVHDRIAAHRQHQSLLRAGRLPTAALPPLEPPAKKSKPSPDDDEAVSVTAVDEEDSTELSMEMIEGGYDNVSVIRANAMKHLPNFFTKGQVSQAVLPLTGQRVAA
jgi:tRNA (guanine-N7-)-methyltransferase